jgi:hypothetical protein
MIYIYNEKINQINFNNFNEDIWKKCFELYKSHNKDSKKGSWFRFLKKSENKALYKTGNEKFDLEISKVRSFGI